MEINKIVKHLIKKKYPESSIFEGEVIGLRIDEDTRISFNKNRSIILKFANIEGLSKNYIESFFEGSLSFENSTRYYYENGVSIYARYGVEVSGVERLTRAIDLFERFQILEKEFNYLKKLSI